MAREAKAAEPHAPAKDGSEHDWEAHDAMHTLLRAAEVAKDKALMSRVKKHAKAHAEKSRAIAEQAEHLAKRGRISPKQMAKLGRA